MPSDDPFEPVTGLGDRASKTTSTPRKPAAKGRTAKATVSAESLRAPLVELYTTIGVFTSMRNPLVGATVGEQAEACADAWVELAKNNQTIARALAKLVTGASMGAIVTAHVPIFMALVMSRQGERVDLADDQGTTVDENVTAGPWGTPAS